MPNSVFTNHSREFKDNLYTYPVISRRSHGLSLGINLSFRKECNFDCVYCQVNRQNMPTKEKFVDLDIFRQELIALIEFSITGEIFHTGHFQSTPADFRQLRDISFSGDGEPTTSKYFATCAQIVKDLILEYQQQEVFIKPVVISNASRFHQPNVEQICIDFHKMGGGPWVKLDAADKDEFARIAETALPFSRILENIVLLGRQIPLTLQSILYKEANGNLSFSPKRMIILLHDLLAKNVQIANIQLYTLARTTRVEKIQALSTQELQAVANEMQKAILVPISVFS